MRLVPEGRRLVESQQEIYELDESISGAKRAIDQYIILPLNRNQYSALVPLVMYLGVKHFRQSRLLKLLNRKTKREEVLNLALMEFDKYIYAEAEIGRVAEPFLVDQRNREKALFITPVRVK